MLRTRVREANARPELQLQHNFYCRHDKWQTHFFSLRLLFSSSLPSFVFLPHKRKFRIQITWKTFLSNFFPLLQLVYCRVHILWIKLTGAVFLPFFPSLLDRKSGVCVQFSVSFPCILLALVVGRKFHLNELWTVANFCCFICLDDPFHPRVIGICLPVNDAQ